MIRFLIRAIGFFALAGGFVAILYDGTHAIAAGEVAITSMADLLKKAHPNVLPQLEGILGRYAPEWGVNGFSLLLLRPPAAAVLLAIGSLFMLFGRPKRPKDRSGG